MTGEPGITPEIPPAAPPGAVENVLAHARAAILWERVWPQFAWAGTVTLVFLALSWFGLWERLPPYGRIAGVALFGIGLFLALNPLIRIALPGRAAALARIDRASGVRHRPATALTDPLASTAEDPVTRALWAAHRDRAYGAAKGLRAGTAQPRLARRDPRALRFAAILAALVAFVMAGEQRGARILSAFDWNTPAGGVPPRLDAWVAPPPYTGRPPIFLTSSQSDDRQAAVPDDGNNVHTVPFGSVLVVRASGGEVAVSAPGARELGPDEKAPNVNAPPARAGEGVSETRLALENDTEVTVEAAGPDRVWRFAVTPDAPPKIAFSSPPRFNRNGSLALEYVVEDDYGVVSADARVELRPEKTRKADAAPPRPLYGPPEIRLALPQGRARSGPSATSVDLVEHPWAGTRVLMTLVARDEPDQEGMSEQLDTVLPARPFTHPLARALVEQRRNLALDANARRRVGDALDALSLYPERFTPDLGIYLGLRSAQSRLFYARTDEDLRGVVDYLWEIATRIEDGDLSGFERDLKQAEQNLRDALGRDASDEEIKKLMDELRAALDKYMQELARRMEQQPSQQAELPPGAKLLTPQDLKEMLDRMENLARGGNREAAQDLLSELRDMLNNLQTARPGQMDPGSEAAAKALDELGRMIREQSELRDRTFRERQPGSGQRQQQGQQPGQQGEGQPNPLGQLGQEQGALRQRLEQLLKELEGQGMQGNQSLGEAGEEMGSAEGQLGKGDANRAFNAQGRALEALRQGAQGMAEQMMQGQGQGGQGQAARPIPGQPSAEEDVDPLGRPTRARRYDPGSNVRVPGEIDAQRARRVQEELRKRLGEPERPQEELDYYERLLRD